MSRSPGQGSGEQQNFISISALLLALGLTGLTHELTVILAAQP